MNAAILNVNFVHNTPAAFTFYNSLVLNVFPYEKHVVYNAEINKNTVHKI